VILEFVRTGGLIRDPLPTIGLKLSIVRRVALPTDWRAPHTSEVEQFASRGRTMFETADAMSLA
jgi:hypothetical protein